MPSAPATLQQAKNPSAPQLRKDSCDIVECGGDGNCGYLALATAVELERGEDVETLKPQIPTRARTIRHDLFFSFGKA